MNSKLCQIIFVAMTCQSAVCEQTIQDVQFTKRIALSPPSQLKDAADVVAKKPVIVYYANDVRTRYTGGFDRSIQAFVTALSSFETDDQDLKFYLTDLSSRLLGDIDLFNLAVDIERDTFVDGFCGPQAQFNVGLAVFRNSGNPPVIEDNKWYMRLPWEYCNSRNSKDSVTHRDTLKLPVIEELRASPSWMAQPLSTASSFSIALEAVKLQFPEHSHRYIFILKSQADFDNFIVPWIETDLRRVEPEALVRLAEELKEKITEADRKTVKHGLSFYRDLNIALSKLTPEHVGSKFLSVQKHEILEHIAQLGGGDPTQGMFFSSFIFDGVHGGMELSSSPKIKPIVQSDNYEKLNIRNISGYYTRASIIEPKPVPYYRIFDLFGVKSNSRDFDQRFELLMEELTSEKQK